VSIPLGAVTVGAIYAKNADSGSGWGVGAQYNLSKRTFLNTSYGQIDDDAMASDTTEKNQYRIMLRHNF
jgi:predicted porin